MDAATIEEAVLTSAKTAFGKDKDITLESVIDELSLESRKLMALLVLLEDATDIELSMREASYFETIGDIVDAAVAKL